MLKSLFLTFSLLCIIGCTGQEPKPKVDDGIQPITSSEFLHSIGNDGIYLSIYDGLDERAVLSLNANPDRSRVTTTAIDQDGHLFVVDAKYVTWVTSWKDGVWQIRLRPETSPWLVRYNLAVLDGVVVGTVGEVNHGQDDPATESDGN